MSNIKCSYLSTRLRRLHFTFPGSDNAIRNAYSIRDSTQIVHSVYTWAYNSLVAAQLVLPTQWVCLAILCSICLWRWNSDMHGLLPIRLDTPVCSICNIHVHCTYKNLAMKKPHLVFNFDTKTIRCSAVQCSMNGAFDWCMTAAERPIFFSSLSSTILIVILKPDKDRGIFKLHFEGKVTT